MTSKQKNDDQISTSKIILNEYDNLWKYYISSVDERFKLFDWYFKIVTLPFVILSGLTSINTAIQPYLPYAFAIIFLCGFCINILYAKQSAQSKKYDNALKKIREYFKNKSEILNEIIVIDEYRKKKNSPRSLGSIKFWRSLIIILFNSSVLTATIISIKNYTPKIWFAGLIFIFMIFFQILCYNLFYKHYLGEKITDS